ncbi:unnamed protein product [Hymenolepis diminuta]|uniref:Dynein regulatory complex protein 10 n=1 Tax=Hymenolepis diminuta TaxID=6216 RepID=A0A158QCG5_HYMDI|nr:unnamed protein product [Hymenolepis diminuta]
MTSEQESDAIWNKLPPINDRITIVKKSEAEISQNKADITILKPTQKHVSTIEGKQVMQIMDNCISKILLVSALPKIAGHIAYYELLLGGEICDQIKEYKAASNEYDAMLIYNQKEENLDQCKLKKLKERITNATRQIIHCMLAKPEITSALIKHYEEWKVEPEGAIRDLASFMVQLRFTMHYQLLFSPQETAKKEEFLEQTRRQEIKQAQEIRRLEEQQDLMIKKHNKVIETKIQEIELLNSCLISKEEEMTAKINEMREKYLEEYNEAQHQHMKTINVMSEEAAATKRQYEDEIAPFQKQELMIRRQKWILEDQLHTTIKKMDEQLFKLQAKYDETQKEFDVESREYESLNAIFEPLKERYDEVMEIRRKEEEARQQAIKEQVELVECASFITSLYRAYMARRRIRLERKKGIL